MRKKLKVVLKYSEEKSMFCFFFKKMCTEATLEWEWEKLWMKEKQERVKLGLRIRVCLVGLVFVGCSVNGLMCLRMLGPVRTVSLGRTSRSHRLWVLPAAHGFNSHTSSLSCPGMRWTAGEKMEMEGKKERGITLRLPWCCLLVLMGLGILKALKLVWPVWPLGHTG